jgi:putative Mg2+ transporter-C (MgtC) family protein
MGFLGAGAIIKGKGSVRGLTTAASMWLITAIGLCIGAGVIYPAIAVTCIVVLILYLFPFISSKIRRHRYINLTLTFSNIGESVKEVIDIIKDEGHLSIKNTNYSRSINTNEITYVFNIVGYDDTCLQKLSNRLMTLKNLASINFEEAEVP